MKTLSQLALVLAVLLSAFVTANAQQLGKLQPAACHRPWIETSAGDVGSSVAKIASSKHSGVLGITYVQGGQESGQLIYAAFDHHAGMFVSDPSPVFGPLGGVDLKIDDLGTPHLSFNRSSAFGSWGSLYYLTKVQGLWVLETIDATHQYGYLTSIVVDDAGACHVAAREEQDGDFWYWSNSTGSWLGEVIDSSSNPGRYSSIGITGEGVPAVVYSTWAPLSEARYAVRVAPGEWQVSVLSTGDTYRVADLAIDAEGLPHVTYHYADPLLYYATFGEGGWTTELVSALGGKYASLDVDPHGLVHVAFSSLANELSSLPPEKAERGLDH